MPRHRITLTINDSLLAAVQSRAQAEGTKRSVVLRSAIHAYMEKRDLLPGGHDTHALTKSKTPEPTE